MGSFWVKKGRSLLILFTSLTLYSLTGCTSPQDVLNPFSQAAAATAQLFYGVFWVAVLIFILVEGLLVYFVIRYQRRSQEEHPEQYHGHTKLEITWTVIPALILLVVFVFTIRTMSEVGPTNPPGEGIPIRVVGHQWWWEIQYNDGSISTATELHIPIGQVVTIELLSDNVIHSFWVPSLMGKTDTMPGHTNRTWLLGDVTGTFDGQCAEFCGVQHAHMLFRVIVETPGDFQDWLAAQQAPPVEPAPGSLEAQGKEILLNPDFKCVGCHAISGTTAQGVTGPNLTHFASRTCFAGCMFPNTPENIARWLDNPQAMKPGNLMVIPELTPDQIAALTAYVESLR